MTESSIISDPSLPAPGSDGLDCFLVDLARLILSSDDKLLLVFLVNVTLFIIIL